MSEKPSLAEAFSLDDFLGKLTSGARQPFLALRALLLSLGPDVIERVLGDEVQYHRMRAFAMARVLRGRLLLVFPDGETLKDPLGRMLRKGRERYVRLDDVDDLDGHIQGFVREAYVHAR